MDYLYDKVEMYDSLKAIMQGKANTDVIANVQAGMSDIEEHMLHFLENHDEQRIASPEFAGSAEKAKPAMVVSALISRSPTMIYFSQEVGEAGALDTGFGDPSRTTIFDYAGVPAHQRLMNGRKFDGGLLSAKEKDLHKFYRQLLSLSAHHPVMLGSYREIHGFNREQNPVYDEQLFAFVRTGLDKQKKIVVISNFSDRSTKKIPLHLSPALIDEWQLKSGDYKLNALVPSCSYFSPLSVSGDGATMNIQLQPYDSLVLELAILE
jgi:hypothetical protein